MSDNAYTYREKPGSGNAPLVFAFHGTGGDENQFFTLIEAILPEAGIIAPRGDVSEAGANRFFRRTGEGVYDMDDLAVRTDRMAGFVSAHKARHPGTPVYGLGYSNGANILASVMLADGGLFDRVVLMHPLIPWTPADSPALSGRAVLITSGQRDPICPPPQTRALVEYFRAQHSRVEHMELPGGHEVSNAELQTVAEFLARVGESAESR